MIFYYSQYTIKSCEKLLGNFSKVVSRQLELEIQPFRQFSLSDHDYYSSLAQPPPISPKQRTTNRTYCFLV